IQFRRSLVGDRWNAWLHLVRRLMDVQILDQTDKISWRLTTDGLFSVKSMYSVLINSGPLSRTLHI
uniref:Uncharacterized protein n=1 Tax=Aegilops tauschii subsp. strangulata TaxID=200361 RepID=A0A453RVQ9_AEGTS